MKLRPLDVPHRTEDARRLTDGPFAMPRTIRTARLHLVPLRVEHHAPFARLIAEEDTAKWIGGVGDWVAAFGRLCAFAGQWRLFGFGQYALLDADGLFVGFCGLHVPVEWPEVEIGYALMPHARGRGYACEAIAAVRKAAGQRGAATLVSYIRPDNHRSIAAAERSGAVREGEVTLRGKTGVVMRHTLPPMDPSAADDHDAPPAADFPMMPHRIDTPRFSLAAWRVDHFEAFAAMMSDAVTTRFTSGVLDRSIAWRSMAAGAGSWLVRGYGTYAIELDGTLGGFCGLYHPADWPEVELAYSLAPHARGRGIATQAAAVVRDIAAEQGLGPLVSYVHPDNTASQRVADRLGAVRETEAELGGGPIVVHRHVMPTPILQPVPAASAA